MSENAADAAGIREIRDQVEADNYWRYPGKALAAIKFLLDALTRSEQARQEAEQNQYPPDGTCIQCGTANAKGGIVADEPHEGRVLMCHACGEKTANFYGLRRAVQRAEQAESALANLTAERDALLRQQTSLSEEHGRAERLAIECQQLRAALKAAHETLNNRVIGEELSAGHHETSAVGWQRWMARRAETIGIINATLAATSPSRAALRGQEPTRL